MNYKPENGIPWLFTDFDNIYNFPWLFKKFPDLIPLTDSNPVINKYHKNWIRIVCLLRLSKRSSILAAHMFTSRGSLTYVVIW